MNKLMGFYEMQRLSIPTIPWKEYMPGIVLSDECLWTVRSAVNAGHDIGLPRLIGATAEEATSFAEGLYRRMHGSGVVIYYPYFIASKSGVVSISWDKTIIEVVRGDLQGLTEEGILDFSMSLDRCSEVVSSYGNEAVFGEGELQQLVDCTKKARLAYRGEIVEGKTVLLEWSFALTCDRSRQPVGEPYLIFYEVRSV